MCEGVMALVGVLAAASVAMGEDGAAGLSAGEVRSLVAGVMADASSRTSLGSSGGFAGYREGGFAVGTADGAFSMRVGGDVQFRWLSSFLSGSGASYEGGFEARRTRLDFRGRVGESLGFVVLIAADRGSGTWRPEFVYGSYTREAWRVRWGKFRVPFLREQNIVATSQLAVDRSLVSTVFGQGFSELVEVRWREGAWSVSGSMSDGFGNPLEDGGDAAARRDGFRGAATLSLTGRVEWKPAGAWGALSDFTSAPGSATTVMVGAAGHWETGDEAAGGGMYDGASATCDVSLEGDGWNAFASGVWRRVDSGGGALDDFGLVVQGGVFVPGTDVEMYGRCDVYVPDGDREGDDPFTTLTAGVNWYVHGQALKVSLDVQWFVDDPSATDFGVLTESGAIGFPGGDGAGAVTIRGQVQLQF